MFQHRASDFSPSAAAIQKHLGAVVKELEKIGRIGGRQTTEAVATASDQISDAISTILGEMMDRFRKGRQVAGDQAGRLGNQALDLGTKYGSNALQRVASEAEHRPLITVGVALGRYFDRCGNPGERQQSALIVAALRCRVATFCGRAQYLSVATASISRPIISERHGDVVRHGKMSRGMSTFPQKAAIASAIRIDVGASGTALGNAVRVADASVPTAIQYREQL